MTAVWHHMHRGLAVAAAIGAAPALAQVAPPAAPVTPTREEILRAPEREAAAPSAVSIENEDGIDRAPCPLANPEFSALHFTLRDVQFSGGGPIDPAMLARAWADAAGQDIPIARVCDIRDRAAAILRDAGYLAAVRVPVQTIDNGVVRLDILAARLVGIQVRGDAGPSERQLAQYLRQLEGQELFNAHDAERYLLLATDIPGIDARLTLRPAGNPGEVIGEVTVVRTPAYVDLNIQNFGGKSVGRLGGIARVRLNGITGLGDETTLGVYSTANVHEQQVVQAGHSFRLGGNGLTLSSDFTYAWTRPSIAGNLPIRSETLVWTSAARYPITLRQSRTLWAAAGFDWIDQDVEFAAAPFTRDRLRVAWGRLDAQWIDPASVRGRGAYDISEPRWRVAATLEARQGLAIFGASDGCRRIPALCTAPGAVPVSRNEGDPSAFVLRGSALLEVRPIPAVTFSIAPRGQYSPHALLSYEEYSAGNFTIGRGYDPGSIIGDSGAGFAAEVRFGRSGPPDTRSVALQPYVFYDAAWVWNEDSVFAGVDPQRLASAGGGLRMTFGNIAYLDTGFAVPLRRPGITPDKPPVRFLVTFTTQFGLGR